MFINRLDALKILLKYTNDPIAQHRIVDEKDISKLFTTDAPIIQASMIKKLTTLMIGKIKTNDLIPSTVNRDSRNGRI